MRSRCVPVCLALIACVAAPAFAVDGVREINQTCATTTGCFTGDTAGFPVTITLAGSYRLTGNVASSSVNADVISIATSNVTIDLNGFSVTSPAVCNGAVPVSCAPAGSGRGIAVSTEAIKDVTVRNGTVTQISTIGVLVGKSGRVEDVRVTGAGSTAIVGDDGSEIVRCTVDAAGSTGIRIDGSGAMIAENTVRNVGNDLTGVSGIGIEAGGSIVRGNVVRSVYGTAVIAVTSLVSENTIVDNYPWPVNVTGRSLVIGNVVDGGIVTQFDANIGYRENCFSFATVTGGVNLGGNLCNGALCP
jgi:hypothetical protein